MNWRASRCCWSDGRSGYEAAIECRRFQEERPSTSTSGGQSGGGWSCWEEVWGFDKLLVDWGVEVCFLVMVTQAAKDVQERHLFLLVQQMWISSVWRLTVSHRDRALRLLVTSSEWYHLKMYHPACPPLAHSYQSNFPLRKKNRGRTGGHRKRWAWSYNE